MARLSFKDIETKVSENNEKLNEQRKAERDKLKSKFIKFLANNTVRCQFPYSEPEQIPTYEVWEIKIGNNIFLVDALEEDNDRAIKVATKLIELGHKKKVKVCMNLFNLDTNEWECFVRPHGFMYNIIDLFEDNEDVPNTVFDLIKRVKSEKDVEYKFKVVKDVKPIELPDEQEIYGHWGIIKPKTVEEFEVFIETGNFPIPSN